MELQTKANSVMSDEKIATSRRSFDDYHKEKKQFGYCIFKKSCYNEASGRMRIILLLRF